MTLDRAHELFNLYMAGGYNRNSAKLILAEIFREDGQVAVNQLIRKMNLGTVFGFKAGEKLLFSYHSESFIAA